MSTVIFNPVSPSTAWQPFNPAVAAELPKVERYGFSFADYRSSLAGP